MIEFSRSKLISIYIKDKEMLNVHGVLEDDIYGIELDIQVKADDLAITSINGRWIRQENHYCTIALPVLEEIVGWKIDEDFPKRARKFVGRKACIQFADLIIECADAIMDANKLLERREGIKESRETEPHTTKGERITITTSRDDEGVIADSQDKDEEGAYMDINIEIGSTTLDLHVHSYPQSPCSNASVDEMIETAKAIGLDGICLTDHNFLWSRKDIEVLREKHDFLILRGIEVTTDQGDVLVFGFDGKIDSFIKIEELQKMVKSAGGVIIVAHPFRGFLTFSTDELGLSPERASERPVFRYVDAIEVLNSKVSKKENNMAKEVAEILNLPKTAGSDAHKVSEVGLFATRFFRKIRNEADLVDAILSREYEPVIYRKEET